MRISDWSSDVCSSDLPIMRQLTIEVEQSCHLAVHTRGQMAVIARMESSEQLGFSVRVGYRRALHESASGAVLYAFQPPDIQERWERLNDPPLPRSEEHTSELQSLMRI